MPSADDDYPHDNPDDIFEAWQAPDCRAAGRGHGAATARIVVQKAQIIRVSDGSGTPTDTSRAAGSRDYVLKPALARSKLDVDIKMHALRHAHASWLLAGGANLQVVKKRLGHGSIATT